MRCGQQYEITKCYIFVFLIALILSPQVLSRLPEKDRIGSFWPVPFSHLPFPLTIVYLFYTKQQHQGNRNKYSTCEAGNSLFIFHYLRRNLRNFDQHILSYWILLGFLLIYNTDIRIITEKFLKYAI